jgi:serine/threonine-protein kinase
VSFLVMELAEGPSLADRLAAGPLPWRVAVRVCAEVAAGLAAMHDRGLVHSDVKPGNVMLTRTGAKVVDFGIATVAGDHADRSPGGLVLGTPAYLAPERVTGGAVTPATDVYALGLLLYRALTGTMPWSAATATGMIRAHCYVGPAPLPAIDGLPWQVRRLCGQCLSKDPAERPDSAGIARVLRAAAEVPSRSGHPARVAAGTMAAIVLACGLLTASQPGRPGSPLRSTAIAAGPAGYAGAPAGCAVRYQTRRDVDGAFAVDLTVTNTADRAVSGGTVTFDFPGRQQITAAGWTQSGRQVRSPAGVAALAPRASVTLRLTGTHPDDNPLPTRFALDGAGCAAQVSGATSITDTEARGVGPEDPPNGGSTSGSTSGTGGGKSSGGGMSNGSGKSNGTGKAKGKGKGKNK